MAGMDTNKPDTKAKDGYPLKAGQPAKSGNCAEHSKLFIAGLLANSETSKPKLLSRLKWIPQKTCPNRKTSLTAWA